MNGYREDGGITIEFLANMYRCVRELVDERDRLQARIDAYEGRLEEWEAIDRLIAESSLGTEAAQRVRDRVPPEVGKLIVRVIGEAERADRAEDERDELRAKLHELMARDVDMVDLNVQYGCPDCGVHHACGEIVAERDRLRAVVQAARAYMDSIDSADPTITRQHRQECMGQLRRALRALDVSGDTGDPLVMAEAAHYLSTYCLHGNHADCRLTCKTCRAPCRCRCHASAGDPQREALGQLVADAEADGTYWGVGDEPLPDPPGVRPPGG